MSEAQKPCGGRLCMDGVGADCIYTCLSATQMKRATEAPVAKAPVGKAFPARYAGRCRECRGSILEGDSILFDVEGVVHEGCA